MTAAAGMRLGPRVAVLKEGSDKKQGVDHVAANAAACKALADIVATTLGPRGNDLLLVVNDKPMITNDGATILETLNVTHPAAKLLVEMSQSQDKIVGDGTTSVVLLASEAFSNLAALLCSLNPPHSVVSVLKKCNQYCEQVINETSIDISNDLETYMLKTASTALSSKLIAGDSKKFGQIAVDAVKIIGKNSTLQSIGIKTQKGGSVDDSMLIEGFAIPKCFAYAGAKSQPYEFKNPNVALLKIELELKAERVNAEVRINTAEEYQNVVDAEWKILFDKCAKIAESGANVVLSSLPIGDVATQFFADRGIYCGGRVAEEDMTRGMKSLGGSIQTSLDNLKNNFGTCESFEEIQVGDQRYNIFKGSKKAKSCTIILRGGNDFYIEETRRSLHDALKVVQRAFEHPHVVPGGGSIELTLSSRLREWANKEFKGKQLIFAEEIARSFEIIPLTLAKNCGYDQLDTLSKLRALHNQGKHNYGVSITDSEGIADNLENGILEPTDLTRNKLYATFESILMLLLVDKTVQAPTFKAESQDMMNAKNALRDH